MNNVPYKSKYLQYDDFENTDITDTDDDMSLEDEEVVTGGLIFPEDTEGEEILFSEDSFSDDLEDETTISVTKESRPFDSFGDLIRFNIETCGQLLGMDSQDNQRIKDFIDYCNTYLNMSDNSYLMAQHPKIDVNSITNTMIPKQKPVGGFVPLQVQMVSFDPYGNTKEIDVNGTPDECSMEDVCTVCADDEF